MKSERKENKASSQKNKYHEGPEKNARREDDSIEKENIRKTLSKKNNIEKTNIRNKKKTMEKTKK